MILCKASQTAISKAVCYKTKNEQLREKAVHFLLVAINCFYAGLPTIFCTITIVDGFDLRVSFSINFQVSDDPVHIRWFMPTDFLPIVMQNEVKHLSTYSSLTLRMTG